MKGFGPEQREVFSDYFRKVALMAMASLFFGQFIPGQTIDWRVVTGGAIFSLFLIIIAALITKEDNIAFKI